MPGRTAFHPPCNLQKREGGHYHPLATRPRSWLGEPRSSVPRMRYFERDCASRDKAEAARQSIARCASREAGRRVFSRILLLALQGSEAVELLLSAAVRTLIFPGGD